MRESGILMHITSLPGPYGIGTMGAEAYRFVDFLEQAGQSCWQILPLSPTGYGDSPYQAFSSFAGNHYLIDLDTLVEEGLLKKAEITRVNWGNLPGRVDFGTLYRQRTSVLKIACDRFTPDEDYAAFRKKNAPWLEDYALFLSASLGVRVIAVPSVWTGQIMENVHPKRKLILASRYTRLLL